MKQLYVFRLDGSKANDAYFQSRTCPDEPAAVLAYQGRSMSVGPNWKPDLVEVEITDDARTALLTLVELEPNLPDAMASCRKYLPEPAALIIRRFLNYLDAVLAQCKTTADPRGLDIRALKDLLLSPVKIVVRTAGALRSHTQYCELHNLIRQARHAAATHARRPAPQQPFAFRGTRSLNRREKDRLRRTIRILHAVLDGKTHYTCAIQSWGHTILRLKPMDWAVTQAPDRFPLLHDLLRRYARAPKTLDCDRIADEMAALWTDAGARRWTPTEVAVAIERFINTATAFTHLAPMPKVFHAARAVLEDCGWRDDADGRKAA